jgi:hypothetical protein
MYFYGAPLGFARISTPSSQNRARRGPRAFGRAEWSFFFRNPALIPQRAVRALGNVPGYYPSSRVAGLGALNFRLLRGISRSALSLPRASLGAEFLLDKDET